MREDATCLRQIQFAGAAEGGAANAQSGCRKGRQDQIKVAMWLARHVKDNSNFLAMTFPPVADLIWVRRSSMMLALMPAITVSGLVFNVAPIHTTSGAH